MFHNASINMGGGLNHNQVATPTANFIPSNMKNEPVPQFYKGQTSNDSMTNNYRGSLTFMNDHMKSFFNQKKSTDSNIFTPEN
jgi:hypothetical protein